jgi:hypothetical protein
MLATPTAFGDATRSHRGENPVDAHAERARCELAAVECASLSDAWEIEMLDQLTEQQDWTKPAAMAIPKDGFFKHEQGRFGPIFPKTPANYGFSVVAKVKPGREQAIREYGKSIEAAVKGDPLVLAPLKLHYLRWVLFDVGSGPHFMYQGIFDTDFDKYLEDAVALFLKTGITTVFVNLEGWPEDWKTNLNAVIKFFRDHQCPSFLEYGEYPYVSAEEVKKALKLKAAFSSMLDLMQ